MTKNRFVICFLIAGLAAGSLAMPAHAKKKKAKPVATTLYMEGSNTFGEQDQYGDGTFLKLQDEPGTGEKSRGFYNGVASPNPNCGGSSLMPVFVGPLSGTVTGDMTVTFDAMGMGGKAEIRVWPDMAAGFCNEAYVEPDAMVVVDLPAGPGTIEATLEDVNFQAHSMLMVQVTPILGAPPYLARVFYGTEDSKIEFKCVPAKGKTC